MTFRIQAAFTKDYTCNDCLNPFCRDGLFARPSQGEQTQVSIDMGPQFDLDSEVEGLSGQVGKLKHVSVCLCFLSGKGMR